ncbi:MAG TPA: hypothetical protein VNQ90_21245 [Chthoniobacteraceae bacterium]|nr:hypothetical protein [Chthoniobacteraceae bacterium]
MIPFRALFDTNLVLIGIPIFLWSAQAVLIKFLITEKAGPFELNLHRRLGAILFGVTAPALLCASVCHSEKIGAAKPLSANTCRKSGSQSPGHAV